MRSVELRDTSRYVLLLESPTKVYQTRIEGSIRNRVDAQIRTFLTEASPESGLQDAQKFPSPLRQLKDRGGKARALGTWCKGDGFDLFVVQILYDKDDEGSYLPKKHVFAERGTDYVERFETLSHETMQQKIGDWTDNEDLLIFSTGDYNPRA
jgi:hypothetical protein